MSEDQITARQEYFQREEEDKEYLGIAKNIIEQIKKSNPLRAVWELSQNARDLARDGKVDIEIGLTDGGISFSHNGRLFTPVTLRCLIKQRSSKDREEEPDLIGQYGTGFATTHAFSPKISLAACIDVTFNGDTSYYQLEGFEIDRSETNPESLKGVVRGCLKKCDELVYQEDEYGRTPVYQTTFLYKFPSGQDGEINRVNATAAVKDLWEYVPRVLAANPCISSYKIHVGLSDASALGLKNGTYSFEVAERGERLIRIRKEDGTMDEYSVLQDSERGLTVFLPLMNGAEAYALPSSVARLMVGFPLIGTENFGINFVINSLQFAPIEQRDSLFDLKHTAEAAHQYDEQNQQILDRASELVFEFMAQNYAKISDVHFLADISLNRHRASSAKLNDYFQGLHRCWVKAFSQYPVIKNTAGTLSKPSELLFFSPELLDEDYFDAVFTIADSVYPGKLPDRAVCMEWCRIVHQWYEGQERVYITPETLIENFGQSPRSFKLSDFDRSVYKSFCRFVFNTDQLLFKGVSLLPDSNGILRGMDLKLNAGVDDRHIRYFDELGMGISSLLLHEDFADLGKELDLYRFDNSSLSRELRDESDNLQKEIESEAGLDGNKRCGLMKLCNCFPSLNTASLEAQGNVMPEAEEFWELKFTPEEVRNTDAENQFDYELARKLLMRDLHVQMTRKGREWNKENVDLIGRIIARAFGNAHYKKSFIENFEYTIFLNQNHEFVETQHLSKEYDEINEELKNIYDELCLTLPEPESAESEFPEPEPVRLIRDRLLLRNFNGCFAYPESVASRSLADKITEVLRSEGSWNDLKSHPHSGVIMRIIAHLLEEENGRNDSKYWQTCFPELNCDKATVMVAQIAGEAKINYIIPLLREEEGNLKILSDLAGKQEHMDFIRKYSGRLDEMFEYAENKVKQDRQEAEHKRHIGLIGRNIQEKILAELGLSLMETIEDKQGGQDFIIHGQDQNPLYHIEVKSRWSTKPSVELSQRQSETAYKNPDNYAVITVDLSSREDRDEWMPDFQMFEPYIRVVTQAGTYIEHVAEPPEGVSGEKIIRLSGYEGIVRQSLFKDGLTYQEFVGYLKGFLKGGHN